MSIQNHNHTQHAIRVTIFSIEQRILELQQMIGSLKVTAKQMRNTLEDMQNG